MAFAQGSRSQLTYVIESSFGTVPSGPAMIRLPINAHGLNGQKEPIESGEIRPDRQVAVVRHGNESVTGSIDVAFRPDDYDDLLESALFGDFTTANVLKLGTTFKSFTFEDGSTDIDQYRVFKGCSVNSFNLQVTPNQMISASFGILGVGFNAVSGTSLDDTPTEPTNDEPFDSFSGSINEGGSAIATVSSLNFSLENNLSPAYIIGSPEAPQMEFGRGVVTGTITAYFEDATLINKFINETESSLDFTLSSTVSGDSYQFDFPKIKYTSADAPLDNEQSRLITLNFSALYNSSDSTSLQITKS